MLKVIARDTAGNPVQVGPRVTRRAVALNTIRAHRVDAEIIDTATGETVIRAAWTETGATLVVETLVPETEPEAAIEGYTAPRRSGGTSGPVTLPSAPVTTGRHVGARGATVAGDDHYGARTAEILREKKEGR